MVGEGRGPGQSVRELMMILLVLTEACTSTQIDVYRSLLDELLFDNDPSL